MATSKTCLVKYCLTEKPSISTSIINSEAFGPCVFLRSSARFKWCSNNLAATRTMSSLFKVFTKPITSSPINGMITTGYCDFVNPMKPLKCGKRYFLQLILLLKLSPNCTQFRLYTQRRHSQFLRVIFENLGRFLKELRVTFSNVTVKEMRNKQSTYYG